MENEDIDLKSDKVRSIIGKIPSRILRQGSLVITLLLLCLIILTYTLPYYDYQSIDVSIQCVPPIHPLQAPCEGVYVNIKKDSLHIGDTYGFILKPDGHHIKLVVPSDGTLHESIIDNAYVNIGQVIGFILPFHIGQIIAIAYVDANKISTFKINQSASLEFNSIEGKKEIQGKILKIIDTKNSKYILQFQIDTNLYDTNFIDSISYNGKAKVLISDIPIARRLLGM